MDTVFNMKKVVFLLGLLCLAFILSCQKSEPEALNDTIYVSYEDTRMPVYIHGNVSTNKMVILIHGGPGGNGLEYRFGEYSDLLEEKMAVAYWDQRGQGMSQGKYGEDKLTVSQMANDLNAVVLTLRKKYGDNLNLFLLGHSWGGMLGTKFMVDPEKAKNVNGWIEANGAHDIPFLNQEAIKMFKSIGAEQISAGNSVEQWNEVIDWATAIDENNISEEEGEEINSKGFEVEGYLTEDGLIAQGEPGIGDLQLLLASPLNRAKSAITGLYTSNFLIPEVESTSLTNELSNITAPCLFLYSKYDFVVPPALGEDAFSKVSSSSKKLVIFEQSGHSSMTSEGVKFANEVIEFVNLHSN